MNVRRLALAVIPSLLLAYDASAMCPRNQPDCNQHDKGDDSGQKPQNKGTINPPFVVVTILYAPPGNGSEVTYGAGSSTGSRVEDTHVFKGGINVEATGNVDVAAGFSAGGKVGSSFETHKEVNTTLGVQSVADALDHNKDVFYLWANPQLDLIQVNDTKVQENLHVAPGKPLQIVPLTARELANPATIPAFKRQQFANAKDSDFTAALRLDPLFSGSAPDNGRYVKIDQLQLDGPDVAGDPLQSFGLDISNEAVQGKIGGWQTALNLSVGSQTGFSFFGLFQEGVKVSGSFEWDYENDSENTAGAKQTASAKLTTSTVGFHAVFDVFYDSLFKTFAFVPNGPSSSSQALSGQTTRGGQAAPFEIVTIALANGQTRRVVSNARGNFRLYGAPAGAAKVSAAGAKTDVVLGKAATVSLALPARRAVPPVTR